MGTVAPVAVNLATFGVADHEAGAASATLNTSPTGRRVAGHRAAEHHRATRTATYLATHPPGPGMRLAAQVDGYTLDTAWAAGILTTAAVITLILVNARLDTAAPARSQRLTPSPHQPAR